MDNAPNTQIVLQQPKPETAKAEIVRAGNGKSKTVFRGRSGMFSKPPKAPTAAETQRAIAAKITATSPENPKSALEEIIEAQIKVAKRTDVEECGTAPTKAAELILKAANLLNPKEDPGKLPFTAIVIAIPDYVEEVPNVPYSTPTKPSWGAAGPPVIDGEVVK